MNDTMYHIMNRIIKIIKRENEEFINMNKLYSEVYELGIKNQYPLIKKNNDIGSYFFYACLNRNLSLIEFLVSKGIHSDCWYQGLEGACEGGHYDLAQELLIKLNNKQKYFYSHFYHACKGGNFEIVQLLITAGANNWNHGLNGACKGGHLELAQFLIDRGADNFNECLYQACEDGHRQVIDFLISKGANGYVISFYGACLGGHLEIAKFFISKGVNSFNFGLSCASEGGHRQIVDLMISLGANDWNEALDSACKGGHLKLIKFLVAKGATNLERGIHYAYYWNQNCVVCYLTKMISLNNCNTLPQSVKKKISNIIINGLLCKKQIYPVNCDCEAVINKKIIMRPRRIIQEI